MAEERLQKILARAGFKSRRASEKLIAAGRVTVNGEAVVLGAKADAEKDIIEVDGQRVQSSVELVYIAVNKPRGVLSTTGGPDRRRKVTDLIPESKNLHIVGRLDFESEGLLLLTNDGRLSNWLSHPRFGHEKEYRVLVSQKPDKKQLDTWQRGVVMNDGYRTRPVKVQVDQPQGDGAWLRVVMKEGRKRQIRESAALVGLTVKKLIRVRISNLKLGNMQAGEWRHLDAGEVQALRAGRKQAKN